MHSELHLRRDSDKLTMSRDHARPSSASPTVSFDDWPRVLDPHHRPVGKNGVVQVVDTARPDDMMHQLSPGFLPDPPLFRVDHHGPDFLQHRQSTEQPSVDANQRSALADAAQQYAQRHAKLQPRQAELLLVQDRNHYAQATYLDRIRFVHDSQTALMEELAAVVSKSPAEPSFVNLRSLHQQTLNDRRALQSHSRTLLAIEEELSYLQSRVVRKEKALSRTAATLLRTLQSTNLVLLTDSTAKREPLSAEHSASSQIVSPPDVPPETGGLFRQSRHISNHAREARSAASRVS